MRKLPLLIVLLLAAPVWGQADFPGVCQGFTTTGANPMTCTFSANVPTGTLLVANVVLGLTTVAQVAVAVSDLVNGPYGTAKQDTINTAASSVRLATFAIVTTAPVGVGQTLTVAFTIAAGANAGANRTVEVDGYLNATDTVEQSSIHHGQSSTFNTTAIVTAQTDLLVSSYGVYGSPGVVTTNPSGPLVLTPMAGWTADGSHSTGNNTGDRSIVLQSQTAAAPGSYTPTGTINYANRVYANTLIAFIMAQNTPTPTPTVIPTPTPTPTPSPTPTDTPCPAACCDDPAGTPQCQAMVGCNCPAGYTKHEGYVCP